jgi:hypothetical protein
MMIVGQTARATMRGKIEPDKDEIDMFIAEETYIISQKPKYHCEYCDKTFKTSNEFCQHKRSPKHQSAE